MSAPQPSRRLSPLAIVGLLAFAGLFVWLGLKLVKYNYPDSLASAKDVPGWMVDGHFSTFTDADMLALRGGQCGHDPIFVRAKPDGSAVLTCGIPAQAGPVLLFVVDALDPNGIYRRAGT
ncbi:hypothetical protein J1C51_23935 [Chromobacterium haemolyticum]|uniref:hypothetical protein n=1 Tax=Chromobacterium haemolyticum TaxID=394935 RepID=UPI001A9150CB|nr:hypothetical protein [Chromobacterium haemolyticum]MBO0501828.1 hypothetical protein [Chromobacterium haemolyticum]